MNVINPSSFVDSEYCAWQQARTEANAWRGRFVDRYARSELAIGRTYKLLVGMGLIPSWLPHAKQRLDGLSRVFAEQSASISVGQSLVSALTRLHAHTKLRHILCHSTSRLLLEQNGRWWLLLETVDGDAEPSSQCTIISEVESERLYKDMQSDVDRVVSLLENYRSASFCQ